MVNGAGNTRQLVPAPPITPSPFGLFSAATVHEDGGTQRWILSGMTWEPEACGDNVHETVAACVEGDELEVDEGIDAVQSSPFTAYHMFSCKLPGRDWSVGDERAASALRLGEQRAAERHLAELVTALPDEEVEVVSDTPLHVVDAVAELELLLAQRYGGTGVIHADAATATRMGAYGLTQESGTNKMTKLGTRLAVGGGYPPGTLMATGQVMVRRNTTEVVRSAMGQLASNSYVALAQRSYVIGWECLTAVVPVTTTYGVPV